MACAYNVRKFLIPLMLSTAHHWCVNKAPDSKFLQPHLARSSEWTSHTNAPYAYTAGKWLGGARGGPGGVNGRSTVREKVSKGRRGTWDPEPELGGNRILATRCSLSKC